jgi:hypothetical protein
MAHIRHRKVLPQVCQQADNDCLGRLEAALRRDAPIERLLGTTDGRQLLYSLYVGDYVMLCHLHHCHWDLGSAAA